MMSILLSEIERNDLFSWAIHTKSFFRPSGRGRQYGDLCSLNAPHYQKIKSRVIEYYSLQDGLPEPYFKDFCGFNDPGAYIHLHSDSNQDLRIHSRINIVISRPESGGNIIYNGNSFLLPAIGESWICIAGKYQHGSTPVIGSIPRIILSFGFLLMPEDVARLESL